MVIGIVGLGLIGGTYAKSLKKYNYKILGIDINQDVINYAITNNIIDEGSLTPKDILPFCDVVFLCLYPNDTISFIKKNINYFKRGSVISDVSGVKRHLINNLEMYKNDDIEIVFTHPLAGNENPGIKYSNEAIFHDSNFIITPTKYNTLESLNLIEILAKQMGFVNVTRLEDYEHDEIVAYTSQLTHVIAISLMNSDNNKYNTSLFIGDSFKELTRIAKINDSLWNELFMLNRDFLIKRIEDFDHELQKMKLALINKDEDQLKKLMQSSTKKRGRIE
jgi:prephenate dehydrogenase